MSTHDFHNDLIKLWKKWHLSIFIWRLVPYCQYSICTKFQVKWTNIFWDGACFFTAGLLATPSPPSPVNKLWGFQNSHAQVGLIIRNSPVVFCGKGVVKKFAKFTKQHMHKRIKITETVTLQRRETLAQVFSQENFIMKKHVDDCFCIVSQAVYYSIANFWLVLSLVKINITHITGPIDFRHNSQNEN